MDFINSLPVSSAVLMIVGLVVYIVAEVRRRRRSNGDQ